MRLCILIPTVEIFDILSSHLNPFLLYLDFFDDGDNYAAVWCKQLALQVIIDNDTSAVDHLFFPYKWYEHELQ